jgi:hypothetical protein
MGNRIRPWGLLVRPMDNGSGHNQLLSWAILSATMSISTSGQTVLVADSVVNLDEQSKYRTERAMKVDTRTGSVGVHCATTEQVSPARSQRRARISLTFTERPALNVAAAALDPGPFLREADFSSPSSDKGSKLRLLRRR